MMGCCVSLTGVVVMPLPVVSPRVVVATPRVVATPSVVVNPVTPRVVMAGVVTPSVADVGTPVNISPMHGLLIFVASAAHTPFSFLYPGPQSHKHTVPPDQHQFFVRGATHASQPRFSAVHVAALRWPMLQFSSDLAHGMQLLLGDLK